MKETGIVRKIDKMGRLVLPKELRWKYNLDCGSLVEIYTEGNNIFLKKYDQDTSIMKQVEELVETMEHFEKDMQTTKELQEYLTQIKGKMGNIVDDD